MDFITNGIWRKDIARYDSALFRESEDIATSEDKVISQCNGKLGIRLRYGSIISLTWLL